MGGDHKCPVCQATFTRPQHVARHMRSHTGDRPYKCQHCGDQFARSDLLSRHVNKCHANEKPPPNAAGGKRKGSAAASRATTSKQACDQCVQVSLPCDGSNPCSKCVSRNCRCTYVKFHRQTAPIGPGHQPPRTVAPSASAAVGSNPHLDDLILGPPPTSVPGMATSVSHPLLSTQFPFNPAYPSASTVDLSSIPVSVAAPDIMTDKFRAHTDFLRRAGGSSSSPSTSIHPASTTGTNVFSGIYTSQSHLPYWHSWGDPSSGSASLFDAGRLLPPLDDKDFPIVVTRPQIPSAVSDTFDPDFYNPSGLGSGYRARRASFDFSDSSSTASHSVPSSATSSSVHLPLPGPGELFNNSSDDVQGQRGDLLADSQRREGVPSSQSSNYPTSEQQRHTSEDGASFFSNVGVGGVVPHSPNATPMPARQASQPQQSGQQAFRDRGMSLSALQTPGEMRDFWKAYVRTPPSGPGGDDAAANTNTSQSQQAQMSMSPCSQRRRLRVSSLPSVTPTVERGHPMMNGYGGGDMDGSRGTMHGNSDDLRSYEAAVNARSASLNLNLVPRRRGTRPGASMSPAPLSGGASAENLSTTDSLSRPSSSSSVSSLAHAFSPYQSFAKPPPLSNPSISLPVPSVHGHGLGGGSFGNLPPSRESSVASDGTGSSEGETLRPSFKRLASQTLGPTNSKRALVERGAEGGGETMAITVADGRGRGAGGTTSRELLSTVNTSLRPISGLPERARRTSEAGVA
ncbi:hypothetical protein EDC04DRAFT_2704655 [Pisolithus marmoratus]|nr:hypothetical protein EDC04DRAFT_2704655 [Pisolithus marmoratus]